MSSKPKDEIAINQQIEELRERMRALRKLSIVLFSPNS
jgi:hypothetical protein